MGIVVTGTRNEPTDRERETRGEGVRVRAPSWLAVKSAMALGYASTLVSTPAAAQYLPSITTSPGLGGYPAITAFPQGGPTTSLVPALTIVETYTNNATLAPSGFLKGSFITTVTPSISLNVIRARAQLTGTAAVQFQQYLGNYTSGYIYPQANILGSIEAVEKFFFIDGAISINQTYISPFGPQPAGNIGVTNNRYTSYAYRLSPYIRGVFPGGVTYLLRNDNIWSNLAGTTSGTPGFAGSYVTQWLGRLDSPIRTFGWTLEGNSSYAKFSDQSQGLSNQIARAILRWRPDPQLRLDAIGGYEWNNYFRESSNVVYGAGGEWRPTDRTILAGQWEERFFGSSYLASLDHRNPYTAFNINASRNITTYPQQLFAAPAGGNVAALVNNAFMTRIPDPVQRAAAVQDFLSATGLPPVLTAPLNYYVQQVILYDQQTATFTILGLRNALAFTVFNRKQQVIGGGTGTPLPAPFGLFNNNTQRGGAISYSHRITGLTSFNATANRTETTALAPFTSQSTTTYFLTSINTELGPKTNGFTGLSYSIFDSNVSNDYNTFAAYVGFSHRF
jgi:uncharacterized protein (PEP-CTERM system associated)